MDKDRSLFMDFKYFNIFQRNADIYFKNRNRIKDPYIRDCIKRASLYGARSFITMVKPKHITEAEDNLQIASLIKGLMALLTPGEFMQIFPIKKEYDGKKWQSKDYFYTRDYINTLDPKKPIGNEILNLLWEYVNTDTTNFNVAVLITMSDLRRLEGYPSIASEWADMEGIKTMTLHEGVNGKDFFIDEQGKVKKVNKNRPKYLKIVK